MSDTPKKNVAGWIKSQYSNPQEIRDLVNTSNGLTVVHEGDNEMVVEGKCTFGVIVYRYAMIGNKFLYVKVSLRRSSDE